jgi:hypothetical protein
VKAAIDFAKAQADHQEQKLQIMERRDASDSRHLSRLFFSKTMKEIDDMKEWRIQRNERRASK